MDIQQAYKIMEVSDDISDDELKKKHRELSFKHHPDRGGEKDKLKSINEAYQFIKEYRENPPEQMNSAWSNFGGFGIPFDISDVFRRNNIADMSHPVVVHLKISFHESIKGCRKQISYDRFEKCSTCNGLGQKRLKNDCTQCDGFGRIISNNNGFFIQQSCQKCFGRGIKTEKCLKCSGKCGQKSTVNGNIVVPAGVPDGAVLNGGSAGNFIPGGGFMNGYTDLLIKLEVEKHPTMSLKGIDVHSSLSVSLLEALKGSTKEVETVDGLKNVSVPEKSKNNDVITLDGLGAKNGKHIINIIVNYPNDVSNIIKLLENNETSNTSVP